MKNIDNILKLITGNSDIAGKKETIQSINEDAEAKEFYRKAKHVWALISSKREMPAYQVEESYQKLQSRMDKPKRDFKLYPYLRYAAIVVAILSVSFFTHYLGKQSAGNEELQYTTVVADLGQISKVILPDSSIVWLNSGTTLTYNNNFSVDNRNLKLKGQAYLDVRKNKNLPLIVNCDNLQVKVLGTRFDVDAYPEDGKISVTLESGSVELLHPEKKAFKHQLQHGEQAIYDLNHNNIHIIKTETRNFTSWRTGLLVFDDADIAEVVKKLERKYGIEIKINNQSLIKSVFNAKFKTETLEEIVEYIEFTCQLKAQFVKENGVNTKLILK